MLRLAIAGLAFAAASIPFSPSALAQQWSWTPPPFDDQRGYQRYDAPSYPRPSGDGFWGDSQAAPRPPSSYNPSRRSRVGGARPAIAPIAPPRIYFPSSYQIGSIVIDHKGRQLFLIQSRTEALRYPISVGREGFGWSGTQKISRIVDWPDWRPPADMRARDPSLPVHMSGGLRNPLGAKALYLGNTLYRIHGTNDPRSIGRASSSGCFRMLNGHVIDLASRVGIGTTVTVVKRLPPELARTVAEQVRGPAAALMPAAPATYTPGYRAPSAPRVKARTVPPPRVLVAPAPRPAPAAAPAAPPRPAVPPAAATPPPAAAPRPAAPPPADGPAGEGAGGRDRAG